MVNLFKHLSIRKKLLLVLGASLFFAGGVILSGVLHMFWMKRSAAVIYDDAVAEAQNVYLMKAKIDQVRRSLLMAVLEKDPARRQENLELVSAGTAVIDEKLGSIKGSVLLDAETRGYAARLLEIWGDFKATRETEIIPLIKKGDEHAALSLALGVQEERFREFTAITDRLTAHSNERAVSVQALVAEKFRAASITFAVFSIAGLLLAISIILYFSRDLRARFKRIMKGIEMFQAGERLATIETFADDELGKVEAALDELFREVYEYKIAQKQYMNIINWETAETEKKRAELQRSEERFRGLVETTSDWVWEVDGSGVYTYSSPRVQTLLGYSPEEVIGKTPFDLMPPEEAVKIAAIFRQIAMNKEPFSHLENVNLHKDGGIVVLETSGIPFFDRFGAFQGYRGIDRDITQRIKAEKYRAEMNEKLIHADKMASIGQLSAGVAHEINNPVGFVASNLNTLSGYINSMMKLLRMYFSVIETVEAGNMEEAREKIGKIKKYFKEVDLGFIIEDVVFMTAESQDGMKRIKKIVSDLRDFAHPCNEEMVPGSLNQCVEDALRLLQHEMRQVGLKKDIGEAPPVKCRPHQITQVLLNIIMNSVQAMEKGSVWIKTWAEDGRVCVSVKDNGPGMSEEVKKKIFDPFFTTKPVGKGTGLGLSIAYGIISDHKGTISVGSSPGKGTVFTISLPADRELAGITEVA